MSGTSLDGIDVAVVDIAGKGSGLRVSTAAFVSFPYPKKVRDALLGASNANTHTATISRLHFLLGELYAEAVEKTCRQARIRQNSLELIGCHGQTIFHEGQEAPFLGRHVASTLQIGEASILAERLGVPVVSDFRPRDMAAGGRGAPLVPFVDYALYRHPRRGRIALNIGGIANITAIPAGGRPEDVIAFDTGPGNMIVDALAAEATSGRWRYDRDARLAAKGEVDLALLRRWLSSPFFSQRPPKTAGREQYGREFLEGLTGRIEDRIATATAFTPASIALSIQRFVLPRMRIAELYVSGGGAHNPGMMAYLAALLPEIPIHVSNELGIDSDAKEAIAFAILAYETWHGRPSNLPSATGARHPAVLGKLTRP
jgi:anhydro-N-acetylmuramic acid kinase